MSRTGEAVSPTVTASGRVSLLSTGASAVTSALIRRTVFDITASVSSASSSQGSKVCTKYSIPVAPLMSAIHTITRTWSGVGGRGPHRRC